MAFRVVRFVETKFWHEDITKRAGTIYGVYVYDDEVGVHCAELAASYELHFVGSTWEQHLPTEEENERLWQEIWDADRDTDPVRYYHCSSFRNKPEGIDGKGKILNCEDLEEATEYVQGNGYTG
jgi:hypothetical protein